MPPSASTLAQRLSANARWVVLFMLLALHAALFSEPGELFQRIWLLVHFGLFLLWQPFFATEHELEPLSVVLLLAITAAILYFLAGWMIVMWLLVLLGILGGRVFTVQAPSRNRFYLIAFAYVLIVLLLRAVPGLVLGAIALTRFTQGNYLAAVVLTVLAFGVALFVLAVLWNPMRGFGGLRTYFSRYLLSVGMPFELWMRRIAELAETEMDPSRFLEQSLREVSELPWVRGGEWRSPAGEGRFGEALGHPARFTVHGLEVVFYTQIELSPALFLHMRLLSQVVGEFYEGKRRETALRRNAYLQAVHETGARLTHDVKNLLQSLYALTSIAPRNPADGYSNLLQRQLPQLTRRLQATLDKLRAPEVATAELPVTAWTWWYELGRRLEGSGIVTKAIIEVDAQVPAALFDNFVDNTLENARSKATREPRVGIAVDFECSVDAVSLRVCDTGTAVPDRVADRLFREPTENPTGLGIGLFNIARLAEKAGYRIELGPNRDGAVCFSLLRGTPAASAGEGG